MTGSRYRSAPPPLDREQRYARDAEWEAADRWRRGEVVPARITLFLDLRGLEGPDVDEACGTTEPAVDEWEAGERYPTWSQLLALASLCNVPATAFFGRVPERVPMWWCSRNNGGRGCTLLEPDDLPEVVDCFSPAVWRPVVAA